MCGVLTMTSDGGDAPAVLTHHQALRHDGAQVLRQVEEDLVVLLAREHVDDAVERLGAVVGVQGREHQMAGAGEADGRLHAVSRSRISPIRITSGAARTTPRSARA